MSLNVRNKYLIIRLSSFGDVLLATPVVNAIKKNQPDAFVGFVSKHPFQQMISTHPKIDRHYTYGNNLERLVSEIRSEGFTHVIDLQNNQRSWQLRKKLGIKTVTVYQKNRIKRFLYLTFGYKGFNSPIQSVSMRYLQALIPFGIRSENTKPDYEISETFSLNRFKLEPDNYICIAPGAAHFTKQWPVEYYIELIKTLQETHHIVLLGGANEIETAELIVKSCTISANLVGKTTFDETAGIIKESKLLICNDSSVMHMATAVQQKVLVFFGSTVEKFGFFPYDTTHIVLENKELSCRPCTHIGRKSCPKSHFNCMNSIAPSRALKAVENLLEVSV